MGHRPWAQTPIEVELDPVQNVHSQKDVQAPSTTMVDQDRLGQVQDLLFLRRAVPPSGHPIRQDCHTTPTTLFNRPQFL
jgi:hypothetical protein